VILATLQINKRSVAVGESIAAAVAVIEHDYGGMLAFDNHQVEGPFVAYGFSRYGAVQIGLRLNKRKMTLYVRERCADGRLLKDAVAGLDIEDRYDSRSKAPVHSIHNGRVPYLKPAETPVLRLKVQPDQLRAVLDACLGVTSAVVAIETASVIAPVVGVLPDMPEDPFPERSVPRRHLAMTPEDLLLQLDRRSVTGMRGEQIAWKHEIERLRALHCPSPELYVNHVALEDVGAGYDIHSIWPSEERYIEVKATSVVGTDFFISANERAVLKAKGPLAWIYRVELIGPKVAPVLTEIQDPMNRIPDEHFTPQVWRVKVPE
jgi:hypothetical protein